MKALAVLAISAGMAQASDDGLRQAYQRVVYQMENAGPGHCQGANPAQRLALEFNAAGARLNYRQSGVELRLVGYGYGDRLRTPKDAKPEASGNRVEYRRGQISEWYINDPRGLEQGFTIPHRPGISRSGEALAIALHVAGDLRPELSAAGDAVLLRSSKGVVLRYAGLRASDARGSAMPSHLQVNGQEVRLVVEDRAAEYPLTVDPTWTLQQELVGPGAHEAFGLSVAVNGYTAIVGAEEEIVGGNTSQGAAYVFVRNGGTWTLQQRLTASDGAARDVFGLSVALSGDTAVVAADNWNQQGAVYVFVRSGGVWTQQQKLTASDGIPGGVQSEGFGQTVSLSGDTLAVGTVTKNAAYVFVRNGGVWSQQQKLTAGTAGDFFGVDVAVSGNTLIAGAQGTNSSQGAAYVFVRSGTTWTQQQTLTANDGKANDNFGVGVAVWGDSAVIGGIVGAAYVFVRNGTTWTQQQKLTASDGALLGGRLAITLNGYRAVIGARSKPNAPQGGVYIFGRRGSNWIQQSALTSSDGAMGDMFGSAVASAGATTVVGAPFKVFGANDDDGATYIFTRPTTCTDLGNNGLAGAVLYDPSIGQEYTALSNANGTYQYVPNLFTSHFDTVRMCDYNGDGIADLILYNSQATKAYIGFGVGDGAFNFGSLFWSVGYDIVETGDINGDGISDVALYNSTTGTLYTGISNGDGTFTYQYHLVSMGCTHIRLADFAGNGKGGLLLYRASDGLASLGVGDGAGNFTFHALGLSPGYTLIDVGDLNADGKTDVILYNPANGNAATGISDGVGGFAFLPQLFTPGFTSVRLADYTGDSLADVTLYNKNNGLAYFGTGTGSGTFSFQSLFWSPGYDYVVPEDVNGDGKADVILFNSSTGTQYTGISNGGGAFTYTYTYWGIGKVLAR